MTNTEMVKKHRITENNGALLEIETYKIGTLDISALF